MTKPLLHFAGMLFLAVSPIGSMALAEPAPSAQWITLGTSGGPAAQAARSQIANALVVNGAVYLFDVGNGVRRQMALAGVQEGKVKAVFLSHHHLDHNADLGPVMVSHWTFYPGVLTVVGPAGTSHLVAGLSDANDPTVLAAFPTAGPAKPPLAATVKAVDIAPDLKTQTLVFQDENVKVYAIGVDHYQVPPSVPLSSMPQAVAYRVEAGGRTFVYSGDTGPSARLSDLARGADVLISEIVEPKAIAANLAGATNVPPAVRTSIIGGMTRNHLVSAEVGRIAASAGVKEVVLTHFVPSPEDGGGAVAYTADLKKAYMGKVTMARDLDRF